MAVATLADFQIQLPPHPLRQEDAQAWILRRHLASARAEGIPSEQLSTYEKIFNRYAVKSNLIGQRYFECADVADGGDTTAGRVYGISEATPRGSSIGQRTQFFSERATHVMKRFYETENTAPDHLVHVTCTGYRSPSAAQIIVADRGWGNSTSITHAYHMGCYAALPAIRVAEGLVASAGIRGRKTRVDIVHNELCGLHMNPAARTPEQIVVQTLFADGHVKYSVREAGAGLKILAIREAVLSQSGDDMAWAPEDWGMQMNLSREVPEKIRHAIGPFFHALCRDADLLPALLQKEAVFAIHPGGPKIIRVVQDAMEVTDEQTADSRAVLAERGNMSSATLPHIWKRILDRRLTAGTKVVSYAFGPGLTVFGAIFEITN